MFQRHSIIFIIIIIVIVITHMAWNRISLNRVTNNKYYAVDGDDDFNDVDVL